MPDYLTIRQTAEKLNLSTDTIRRLIRAGSLPAVKLGGQWRVHVDELTAWVEAQRGK
jgi:excisionase family DNA binding protein